MNFAALEAGVLAILLARWFPQKSNVQAAHMRAAAQLLANQSKEKGASLFCEVTSDPDFSGICHTAVNLQAFKVAQPVARKTANDLWRSNMAASALPSELSRDQFDAIYPPTVQGMGEVMGVPVLDDASDKVTPDPLPDRSADIVPESNEKQPVVEEQPAKSEGTPEGEAAAEEQPVVPAPEPVSGVIQGKRPKKQKG